MPVPKKSALYWKFPEWMKKHLDHLPCMVKGFPLDPEVQEAEIERYMNSYADEFDGQDYVLWAIIHRAISLLEYLKREEHLKGCERDN